MFFTQTAYEALKNSPIPRHVQYVVKINIKRKKLQKLQGSIEKSVPQSNCVNMPFTYD